MKVLAFGDSFVKMFLHCEPEVKHWKFKGKSVKGLVKQDDLERRKIERQVRKTQTGTKILMFFGQVDFNYVRYYKVIKGQPPITEQIFKKYVQWVSSLNNRKNISIVSIFPSPIEKSSVISSLVNKGSYLLEEQTPEIDEKILAEYDKSAATWELWNTWINNYCQKYGVNNIKLFKENRLEPQFYDISKLTIHLRYVPVLKLVKNYVDIKFDAEKAEQIEKQYEVQKVNRIANSNFTLPGEQTPKQIPKENNILSLNSQQKQSSFFEQNTKVEVGIKEQIQWVQKIEEVPSKEAQLSEEVIKNQRKQTADLDTDTNLEKQSEKSKQTEQQLQKQEYGGIVRSSSDLPVQSQSQKKKSKKQPLTKKSKSTKQKEKEKEKEKEKKKYISIEKSESDSEGDGERFLQLASKGRRKY